jgi:AAA domain
LQQEPEQFQLKLISPYSTFHQGEPTRIPFIVDGLMTEGGFSALGAKPKHGKSSLSRYLAVCVAKGVPFLGRDTAQGKVILVSLEDPLNHVDNCFKVLGYDPATDSKIHLVTELPHTLTESIVVLDEQLRQMPDVRLLIIDTLAKFIRVNDLNDYMVTLQAVEQLHNLARKFPRLHVQGLAHCKKIKTDDPFDSLLGSVALRGEPDTNIALFQENGQHGIVSETRMGRPIPPTILRAEVIESAGCDVVKDFSLDASFDEWNAKKKEKAEKKRKATYGERIIEYLMGCEDQTATQEGVLASVEGRRERLLEAIEQQKVAGVLTVSGIKQSPVDPLRLTLHPEGLGRYRFSNGQFGINVN